MTFDSISLQQLTLKRLTFNSVHIEEYWENFHWEIWQTQEKRPKKADIESFQQISHVDYFE